MGPKISSASLSKMSGVRRRFNADQNRSPSLARETRGKPVRESLVGHINGQACRSRSTEITTTASPRREMTGGPSAPRTTENLSESRVSGSHLPRQTGYPRLVCFPSSVNIDRLLTSLTSRQLPPTPYFIEAYASYAAPISGADSFSTIETGTSESIFSKCHLS